MSATKTVVVVGGAGYIGSHCAKILARDGYDVIVYDNLSRGFREAVRYGTFVQGDIGVRADLDRLFNGRRIDAVMHFAAFASVGESVANPEMYFDNNYARTRILVDAMLAHNVNTFIFSSTCAVYGNPTKLPLTEEHARSPINPYGESKLKVEQMLEEYGRTKRLKSIMFRYFNAAGADPDGELGERHNPETHLIPLAFRAALGSGQPLQVFGTDYPTPDGTAVRDYIHVNDLSRAHILGLEYLHKGGDSGAFNLGNGSGFSVREVIQAVESVTGKKVPATDHARRAGDPPALVGDASKAKRVLGWKTEMPGLPDIVKTAYAFEKKRNP